MEEEIDLREYVKVIAKRWKWIVGLTVVAALLMGGVIAAPLAAWLCKKLPHRALGIAIGGSLILLNARTLILALL